MIGRTDLLLTIFVVRACLVHTVHLDSLRSLKPCLNNNISSNLKRLTYSDGSLHTVMIPFMTWSSQQCMSHIAHILLTEILEYSVILVNGTNLSPQAMNLAAGCLDVDDPACLESDIMNPKVHFSVETWQDGIIRARSLPALVRPVIGSVLDYKTYSGLFLWKKVVDDGLSSLHHVSLNFYTSYNAKNFKPFVFFDPWIKMLELIPAEIIVRCSDMKPGGNLDRMAKNYVALTNDTNLTCPVQDAVWFSPACRGNTTECVPVLCQYEYVNIMQNAFWLNLPIALLRVRFGEPRYDAAYYRAVRNGSFLFGWFTPDDSLVDSSGNLPLWLNLPPANHLEQSRHIFRTGLDSIQPRNYVWRYLSSVDRLVSFFVSALNLYQDDIDAMMVRSRALRDAPPGLLDGSSDVDRSRRIACEWVQGNRPRWADWIPARCPPGSYSETLVGCAPCPAGRFCAGGFAVAEVCPVGLYCPTNTSAPLQCPDGRSTSGDGGRSADDCAQCGAGAVSLAGICAAPPALAAMLAAALIAAAGAAALMGFACGWTGGADYTDDPALARKVAELRRRLGIPRAYLLNSRWTRPAAVAAAATAAGRGRRARSGSALWHSTRLTITVRFVTRAEVAAAGRLGLFRPDADPRLVDSLCAALWDSPLCGGRLREWLLEVCATLLDPGDPAPPPPIPPPPPMNGRLARQTTGARLEQRARRALASNRVRDEDGRWADRATQEERFAYFRTTVCALQVWRERALFAALRGVAEAHMDRVAAWCEARHAAIQADPNGQALARFGRSPAACGGGEGGEKNEGGSDGYGGGGGGGGGGGDVASGTVVSWTADGDEKPVLERQIVPLRDEPRLASYSASAAGASCSVEDLASFSRSESAGEVIWTGDCRQDLEEVGAIFVYPSARKEASLLTNGETCPGIADESVFIAQLLLRARLLNRDFHSRVAETIERHSGLRRASGFEAADHTETRIRFKGPAWSPGFDGEDLSGIEIHTSPPKGMERLREKILKYAPPHARAQWPLAANILDPVRCSVVCPSPAIMVRVLGWFMDHQETNNLTIRRVKNKFAWTPEQVLHGYRDVQMSVIFVGRCNLGIIGEIQFHDKELYKLKHKMHKLYKVARAYSPDLI